MATFSNIWSLVGVTLNREFAKLTSFSLADKCSESLDPKAKNRAGYFTLKFVCEIRFWRHKGSNIYGADEGPRTCVLLHLKWLYLSTERMFKTFFIFAFQEVLNCESGSAEPLSIMYSTLLRNYEAVKEEYTIVRKRYDEVAASHSAAVAKVNHSEVGR